MKLTRSASVAIAICLLGVVCSAQLLKRTTTKTDSIPVGAGSTVSITGAPMGSIKVNVIPGNNVQVSAEIEVQAANDADLAGAAVLTTFVTQESAGNLGILSVGRDTRRKFSDTEKKLIKRLAGMPYRIDYTIGVPRYTNVEITAGQGDIDLDGDEGDHRINALNSTVHVSIKGGSLAANVGKGGLHIKVSPLGRRGLSIDAAVATGDLSIMLPENLSSDIDASVLRTGKIFNEIPSLKPRDARKVPFSEKLVQARAGVGGPGIKLTVGDGSLRLQRWVE